MGERVFALADLGEGLTEAEVLQWRVAVGDHVTMNQILVEVETAKAAVELPSPYEGTVLQLLAAEGQVVAVGSGLVRFAVDAPDTPEILVGSGPQERRPGRRERALAARTAATPGVAPAPDTTSRTLASPAVRQLARELGVDLATVVGTGSDGMITRTDVEQAAAPPAPVDVEGVTRTPIRSVRRETAAVMVRSAFTAPHVTEWVSADVTDLMAHIEEFRASDEANGRHITLLAYAARALLHTITEYPDINASWDGARNEIVQYAHVNLGIAVSTERGLLVPNVPNADALDFFGLVDGLADLVAHARAGDTPLSRLTRGTITITNIGGFGIDGGTPILNPPEAAILCMGQVREMPWVVDHQVAVRQVTTLALTFDHRLIDGALGSKVLRRIADLLEQPESILPDKR